jgi:hypothetical protein
MLCVKHTGSHGTAYALPQRYVVRRNPGNVTQHARAVVHDIINVTIVFQRLHPLLAIAVIQTSTQIRQTASTSLHKGLRKCYSLTQARGRAAGWVRVHAGDGRRVYGVALRQ